MWPGGLLGGGGGVSASPIIWSWAGATERQYVRSWQPGLMVTEAGSGIRSRSEDSAGAN